MTLEVEPGSDPPRGRLTSDAGHNIAFTGWAELSHAIQDWWGSLPD